ncbi:MAG: N-acetyltransferase [Lentisphaerae bacterium]|nr:N-acetyltransferase [Lentisphaerota bacterium]
MKSAIIVRPAVPADVDAIFELLELYTASGVVLKRSKDDIAFYLKNFIVAEENGIVCGCCAARDFGHDLFEVRSLVVVPACQGKGIGKLLVNFIIDRMDKERKSWRLFTLTLQVKFFQSLGFSVVEKEIFPEKIWSDCSRCSKYHCCDETALLLEKK